MKSLCYSGASRSLRFATTVFACWLAAGPVPGVASDSAPAHGAAPVTKASAAPAAAAAAPTPALKNPAGKLLRDASLMLLKEGNDRYVAGKPQHPNLDPDRRSSTGSGGQEPFATILGCSDSRGPVELIFDRGVGDLFIVRVAGNIAGESELASLEYGVGHLNTPVLVVLGHSKCGAVTAVTKGAELHGHLHVLAERIEAAAQKARAEATDANDLIPRAIQANVWNTMERILRESSVIREKAEGGAVHLVGAIYDLETGRVAWLGGHPAQDAIIALANQATTDAALAQSKESFAPGAAGHAKAGPAAAKAATADHGHGPAPAESAARPATTTATSAKSRTKPGPAPTEGAPAQSSAGKPAKTGAGLAGGPAHEPAGGPAHRHDH